MSYRSGRFNRLVWLVIRHGLGKVSDSVDHRRPAPPNDVISTFGDFRGQFLVPLRPDTEDRFAQLFRDEYFNRDPVIMCDVHTAENDDSLRGFSKPSVVRINRGVVRSVGTDCMTEHTVVVEREGRSFELWRPGDAGVHDRVEFLDESDVVRMVCTCGLGFDAVEDAWAHLDAVAESRWRVSDPGPGTMKLERDVGGVVSVLVDVFKEELWRFGSSSSLRKGVEQLDAPLAMELWTAEELLDQVKDVISPPEEVTYDVVCYRADANTTDKVGESWELKRGTSVVRVPPSAVVAEVVPDDRPVRVTDSFYAPYIFEDDSE